MALTNMVIMPGADYQDACDAVREKTGGTELIKSGELGGLIRGISGDSDVVKAICEGTAFELTGDNVDFVADGAFTDNNLVKSVSLEKAESIGDEAFRMCDELTSVSLPVAESIGAKAFYSCPKLASVSLPEAYVIGESAFEYCQCLSTVDLSKVRTLEKGAFCFCRQLTNIYTPHVSALGEEAFKYCEALVSAEVDDVDDIPAYAFDGCSSLTGVGAMFTTSIGEHAFLNCVSFTDFIRKDTHGGPFPTKIGAGAFAGCTALTDKAVKHLAAVLGTVRESVFFNCTSLTKADLTNAQFVLGGAFERCTNLSALILRNTSTVCWVEFSALAETPIFNLQGFVYVPAAMYESYREAYSEALDAAYAEMGVVLPDGIFNTMFRKIEDYPEICEWQKEELV